MPNKLQHSPHLEIEKYAQSHEKNNKIIIDFEELKKYPALEKLVFLPKKIFGENINTANKIEYIIHTKTEKITCRIY